MKHGSSEREHSVPTAMSERNVIQQAFDEFGRDAGAEKKSGSWYLRTDEVIAVSNLQKSQYGSSYYFNQGFWLCELGDERYPPAHRCHVQERLEYLLSAEAKDRQRMRQLFQFEREMSDEQRVRELRTLLRDELLPLIQRGSTVDGLRGMLAEGMFTHSLIYASARPVLGGAASSA